MGALTEDGLDDLIARGCPACPSKQLSFRTYVDGRLPLMAGEPVGSITWVYDGEKFVDGVFEVTCAACKRVLFTDEACPRCHAPGRLPEILATPNRWPVPAACPSCAGEEVRYLALIPARVNHDGERAEKARTATELLDPGFHGYGLDCADCGLELELEDHCPLCQSPAPLRPRP
jgi:RNA polymerase subunit RPABC4/transcription elongation factor Spt4